MKYWSQKGKHTELFSKIWDKYVPANGESDHRIGEMVRCFVRINYDIGNNGGGNLVDQEYTTQVNGWGCGYDDDDEYINVANESCIDYLRPLKTVDAKLAEILKNEIEECAENTSFENFEAIDNMGDAVGDYILENYDVVLEEDGSLNQLTRK